MHQIYSLIYNPYSINILTFITYIFILCTQPNINLITCSTDLPKILRCLAKQFIVNNYYIIYTILYNILYRNAYCKGRGFGRSVDQIFFSVNYGPSKGQTKYYITYFLFEENMCNTIIK